MNAAIYVRVSLEDGRQTVENQRQQLTDFCERMGWQVVAELSDNKSGKSLDRPGFKRMMESASKREFDIVVFWDLSRLSRSGVVDVLQVLQRAQRLGKLPTGASRKRIWTLWGLSLRLSYRSWRPSPNWSGRRSESAPSLASHGRVSRAASAEGQRPKMPTGTWRRR